MRYSLVAIFLGILATNNVHAQTADDIGKLIHRLIDLDSIDLAKDVKFRAGLEPDLHAIDVDESAMKVLQNPYEVFGQDKPGAAGWYRVSITVPETLGRYPVPKNGFNLGVESNVLGRWEIYSFLNGKPAGASGLAGPGVNLPTPPYANVLTATNQPATYWMSNAPISSKPGDKLTVVILAMSSPLGRGNPEGFGLRHLRLRFALGHSVGRGRLLGAVTGPGKGNGLFGAREMLAVRKGDELTALQERLKTPLSRMNLVFDVVATGKLDDLTKAMATAGAEIDEALKK